MSNYKQIFSWSLIFLFVFSSAVLSVTNIAKAEQAPNSSPIEVNCSPSVGGSDTNSGNAYAQLNCTWSTPFKEDTVDHDSYDWLVSVYNNTDKAYFGIWKDMDMKFNNGSQNNNFYGDTGKVGGIGWNKNYTITIKLHNRTANKVTSSNTWTGSTGSPQQNGISDGEGKCNVAPAYWQPYGNTNNNIRITWTVPADSACNGWTLKITRPDGSELCNLAGGCKWNISAKEVIDGVAQNGTYTLLSIDSHGYSFGKTTLTVDLSESSLTNGLNNDKTNANSDCGCSPLKQGIGYILCQMQCQIINFFATLISTVVNEVLLKSLGLG